MTNRPTIPYDNDGFCTSAGKTKTTKFICVFILLFRTGSWRATQNSRLPQSKFYWCRPKKRISKKTWRHRMDTTHRSLFQICLDARKKPKKEEEPQQQQSGAVVYRLLSSSFSLEKAFVIPKIVGQKCPCFCAGTEKNIVFRVNLICAGFKNIVETIRTKKCRFWQCQL